MATPALKYQTAWTQTPLPQTKRAYAINVNTGVLNDKDGDNRVPKTKICYGSNKLALVRDFVDPTQIVIFTGHLGNVNVVSPSPNGNWVASGDDTGVVHVWEYPKLLLKNTVRVGSCVNDIRWSADSAMIVAAGNGTTELAKAFRFDSQNALGKIDRMTKQVLSVDWNPVKPARVALSDEDNSVLFYHGVPFKYNSRSTHHTRYPNVVRFSPNGKYFATVSSDYKICLWDGQTGELVKEIVDPVADNNHTGSIFGLAWHKDSEQLVTASADKTIKVWNVEASTVAHTWKSDSKTSVDGVDDQQAGVMWSPSEDPISISLSGAFSYWSKTSAEPVKVVQGHRSAISGKAFSRATGKLFTADLDGRVAVTDATTGQLQWFTGAGGHGSKPITALAITPDGSSLYSTGYDTTLQKHDATGITYGTTIAALPAVAKAMAVNSSGVVVVAFGNGDLISYTNGKPSETVKTNSEISSLQFDATGTQVWAVAKKNIVAYDVATLKPTIQPENQFDGAVAALTISSKGRVFSNENLQVLPWKADFSALEHNGWSYHTQAPQAFALSPSENRLISASGDKSLIVWKDLETFKGTQNVVLKDIHPTGYTFVDFIDEDNIITISNDGVIKRNKLIL